MLGKVERCGGHGDHVIISNIDMRSRVVVAVRRGLPARRIGTAQRRKQLVTQMRERAAAISHSPATFLSFEVMILRRNRGLAASPPVRYRLKMAGRLLRCARLEIGVRKV